MCRSRRELSNVPFLNLLFEQIVIPTHIFLQNLASIQPRTSPGKFAAPAEGREELLPVRLVPVAVQRAGREARAGQELLHLAENSS